VPAGSSLPFFRFGIFGEIFGYEVEDSEPILRQHSTMPELPLLNAHEVADLILSDIEGKGKKIKSLITNLLLPPGKAAD